MAVHLKSYRYTRGTDTELDDQFAQAPLLGKVKPGATSIFWKAGLHWYTIPIAQVQRIFRRVEEVSGKLCCGRQIFQIEKLVLILTDGAELELYIGEDVRPKAQALMQTLKDQHPTLQYGKP